ncbi:MAG: DUF2851 family protein [Bacteroidetes bacterium]|nr:DUF2851 family protein [Bacteroidota bacterium]MBU1116289.1 DUF2851 family protein [Bacteroidota bacterium]MBU1797137.1 DUF2851 family protein [Bacteroidota bacterium]
MIKSQDISENELQNIWKKQSFTSTLQTQSGDIVSVLSIGEHNNSASGPDFKSARLRIGNLVYVGDIEIDSDYNNWKTHGHNIDSKYNKVILHISLINKNNQHYIYTKDGRKVPTLTLGKFVKKELFTKVNSIIQERNDNNNGFIRCNSISDSVELNTKKEFIAKLGIERFSKKCDRIYQRLKELVYISDLNLKEPTIRYSLHPEFAKREFTSKDFKDKNIWQQLLYELLFESLGYTQNKEIMLKLARSVNIDFINAHINKNNFIELESLFFNVSGLIPEVKNLPKEEVSEYTLQLANIWEIIGKNYDGQKFSETDWHFFRIRPQNFPTIRIMGGIQYLDMILHSNLIGVIIQKIDEIKNISILINSIRSLLIIRSKGYWKTHYIFDQPAKNEIKYFIGFSRADEIMVNIILPFFMVYFDAFGKKEQSKKILHIYNLFKQKDDNKITREVSNSLGIEPLINNTIYAQGMIELYRNYCSKNNCLECEIGKIVFN